MGRGIALASLAMGALLIAAPAAAQPALEGAKSELAGTLSKIEGEFINREAIDMNAADLEPRINALQAQIEDLNRRYDDLNTYCQGEFEEPEYSRRVAYCDSTGAQLDTLKAQLQPELESVQAQAAEIQRRGAESDAVVDTLKEELTVGLTHLVLACLELPLDQQKQLCQLPPAPGPRTLDMVAEMNAELSGDLLQQ